MQVLQEECAATTERAEEEKERLLQELHRRTEAVQSFQRKVMSIFSLPVKQAMPLQEESVENMNGHAIP